MNKTLKYVILVFLFVAAGCSGARTTSVPILPTPTSGFTPVPQNATASVIASRCSLLDSYDLANLYATHTEVSRPALQVSQADHVEFSTQNVSANETSCVYYVFHLPGSIKGQDLQVSYWVDTPAGASTAAWAQVWSDASTRAPQSISGIGDGAFYAGGKLTFKRGDYYVTIEVVGTGANMDTSTPAGIKDQLNLEKKVALDALKNF